MVKPEVTKGCCIPKGWGEEIIIENNEKYCGKIDLTKSVKSRASGCIYLTLLLFVLIFTRFYLFQT